MAALRAVLRESPAADDPAPADSLPRYAPVPATEAERAALGLGLRAE